MRTTNNRKLVLATAVGLGALAATAACQGSPFVDPPVHIIPNMDYQQKFEAQEDIQRYSDTRAARRPVEGTVARGHLKADDALWKGRGLDGRLIDDLPEAIEYGPELLARGEERYNIYCAPCHDKVGTGHGVVTTRGGGFQVQPANLHQDRLRAMPIGHFYDVIVNGKGTMLPYASQVITAEDRWAIAAWVRTLQVYGKEKGYDETTGMTSVAAAAPADANAPANGEAAKEKDNG